MSSRTLSINYRHCTPTGSTPKNKARRLHNIRLLFHLRTSGGPGGVEKTYCDVTCRVFGAVRHSSFCPASRPDNSDRQSSRSNRQTRNLPESKGRSVLQRQDVVERLCRGRERGPLWHRRVEDRQSYQSHL